MKRLLVSAITLSLLSIVVSCNKSTEQLTSPASPQSIAAKEARESFAATLAKALERKDVREFIKKETLKQFDEDYDIFFHTASSSKITSNLTLFDIMAQYDGSEIHLKEVISALPKLTISVPALRIGTVDYWNTETLVPKVAAVHDQSAENFNVYTPKGISGTISGKKEPDELTIVVKENERIGVVGRNGRLSALKGWKLFTSSGENQYYFIDAEFDRSRVDPVSSVKARLDGSYPEVDAHNNKPTCPREYAYYKDLDYNGQINPNVKEHLEYLRFVDAGKVNDISDWADGNLEFIFQIHTGSKQNGTFPDALPYGSKNVPRIAVDFTVPGFIENFASQVSVPGTWPWSPRRYPIMEQFDALKNAGILVDYRGGAGNGFADGVWIHIIADGINWDPQVWGTRIRYNIQEFDDDGVTIELGTTFTSEFDASIGKKDTFNVGTKTSFTGTSKYTKKEKSDDICIQEVGFCENYGLFKNPVSFGTGQFVLRVY